MRPAEALPGPIRRTLRQVKRYLSFLPYRGRDRYCPVCRKSARDFGEFGVVPRQDAMCRYCEALERHRLTWLFFTRETDLFDGRSKRVLHVAPEAVFERLFRRRLGSGYLTADLSNPRAMVEMDVTDIQFPDGTFDVIYCSHVLEHVPDDRRAMREMRRVLAPGGWAMLLVPVTAEETFEDPSVTDPRQRLELFGQEDHVRRYGPDFADRLEASGFDVRVVQPEDFLTAREISWMGITRDAGELFYCRRADATPTARED